MRTSNRQPNRVTLQLRRLREGVVVLRASNDTVVDHYGTVITVEALHDWWAGYQQHRTVNLQHGQELRGIPGRAMVGVAVRADFTPQLELEVRLIDPETIRLIEERRITAGSLEFVAIGEERRHMEGRDVRVYHRLSAEPELTGLALVDLPGVPGADILEARSLPPSWAYAVVDPRVLAGEVTDTALLTRLRWLPHHDPETRLVDPAALRRAYAELNQIAVPAEASLSREQIIHRATEHLDRHSRLGLGMPSQLEGNMNPRTRRWLEARAAQLVAEGLTEAEARARAEAELTPELRARLEDPSEPSEGLLERVMRRILGGTAPSAPVAAAPAAAPAATPSVAQTRVAPAPAAQPQVPPAAVIPATPPTPPAGQAASATPPATQPQPDIEQRVQQALDARIQAIMRQPENPMAAIAAGLQVRSQRLEPEQLLSEVLAATVLPQLQQRTITTEEMQRVHNVLRAHGISERALSIEGSGTVIYQELARQFVVRPAPDIVFRNHMRSVPMAGTRKVDFPRFSRAGLTFQWNRSSSVGAGSFADITTSTTVPDVFPIEVTELNGAVPVADGFLQFNASGPQFVQEYLLPELRAAAQFEEDRVFFLSTGAHPMPATFRGLRNALGVTAVTAGVNGDAFVEGMLDGLLRAMPTAFRGDPRRLAFYLPTARADDLLEIRTARTTALGDRILEEDANIPGPLPVARHRGINVFSAPQLPTNETQGTSSDASTIYLVHRDQPVIGDALTIRIEPYRRSGFQTLIQLQQFVGLGYQWPEAIVRRVGVRPRA